MLSSLHQSSTGYRYSIDSYLLADFCINNSSSNIIEILDLGSGCGIISFLLASIYQNTKISAIEIQPDLIRLAKKNNLIMPFNNKINFVHGNICNILKYFNANQFDIIVSNPPYYKIGDGRLNPNYEKASAKHEITCKLKDFINAAKKVLKNKGVFFIIFNPERINELLNELTINNLQPKLIRCVHSKYMSEAKLILIKSVKMGNPGLKILPPIYLFNINSHYSKEIIKIFNGFPIINSTTSLKQDLYGNGT